MRCVSLGPPGGGSAQGIFFRETPYYGPFSRDVIRQVIKDSDTIRTRCEKVDQEIREFAKRVSGSGGPEPVTRDIDDDARQLAEIKKKLESDRRDRLQYEAMARDVGRWGKRFLALHSRSILELRYRPALQDLDRLRLNDEQERLVVKNHSGVRRIQGASGAERRWILIHRSIRIGCGRTPIGR